MRVEIAPTATAADPAVPLASPAHDPLLQLSAYPSTDHLFFRIALQAGLFGVAANVIPFGLGMVLTGVLAAFLYYRASGPPLTGGKAARLGAMAGAIAFAATALLAVAAIVIFHQQDQMHDALMKAMDQRIANPSDPQVQAALQWLHSPEGFATVLAFSMALALLLSMLLSALGSVLGSGFLRDRIRPRL